MTAGSVLSFSLPLKLIISSNGLYITHCIVHSTVLSISSSSLFSASTNSASSTMALIIALITTSSDMFSLDSGLSVGVGATLEVLLKILRNHPSDKPC